MLKSVYQNGGFYVGKYETGIEDAPKTSGSATIAPTEISVIKQNAYPYNYVTCSQAQALFSKQGVYDLAGNVYEWMLEYTSDSSNPCSYRGGFYLNTGRNTPAAYRYNYITSDYSNYIGFRVSIF